MKPNHEMECINSNCIFSTINNTQEKQRNQQPKGSRRSSFEWKLSRSKVKTPNATFMFIFSLRVSPSSVMEQHGKRDNQLIYQ